MDVSCVIAALSIVISICSMIIARKAARKSRMRHLIYKGGRRDRPDYAQKSEGS